MMYYNTTHATGGHLSDYRDKAASQEARIYSYFKQHWSLELSPSQVQQRLDLLQVPITSVRRAITNLTDRDLLEKTTKQVDGLYGRPEYCWRLKKRQTELFQ